MPALLEQSHSRIWLKWLVGLWCRFMAWSLDLHSYLLGDEELPAAGQPQPGNGPAPDGAGDAGGLGPAADVDAGGGAGAEAGVEAGEDVPQAEAPAPPPPPPLAPAAPLPAGGLGGIGGGLGAAHHALFQPHVPTGYRPYRRPNFFWVRLVCLVLAMCVSLVLASLIALTVPVWVGRRVMNLCLVGAASQSGSSSGRVHELYTAACGMYLCWLGARAFALLLSWLPQG